MATYLFLSDSYKYSHYNQLPEDATQAHSYFGSRGGEYETIIFNGLQHYLTILNYFKFDEDDINQLEQFLDSHGEPFKREMWEELLEYIKEHNKLPIEIHAIPEGFPVKPGVALFTVEGWPWLVGWLETMLMKVWYPTTIATKCYAVKQMLKTFFDNTSDNPHLIEFAYHNFGDRGSSSIESALIGGLAHLSQFKGTDNFNAACHMMAVGGQAFSIPASEHSTVTSWGQQHEFQFIRNYLETYKSSPIIACVLDSYNIYDAVEFVTKGLKPLIESNEYPVLVMRPDSGDPIEVITRIIHITEANKVAYRVNNKGYKVWNKYRIIWGDGVTPETIKRIAGLVTDLGYSIDNIAFGSGGDLMQNVTRDTCKFAMKMSAIQIGNKWQDVYKDPITDKDKKSKKGRLVTIKWKESDLVETIRLEDFDDKIHESLMSKVY